MVRLAFAPLLAGRLLARAADLRDFAPRLDAGLATLLLAAFFAPTLAFEAFLAAFLAVFLADFFAPALDARFTVFDFLTPAFAGRFAALAAGFFFAGFAAFAGASSSTAAALTASS